MKRLWLLISLAAISLASMAQGEVGKSVIIPKVGLNIANVTNSSGDPRLGIIAGFEAVRQVDETIALSVGVFYSMEGCKASEEGTTVTLAQDYVNVPILFNAYVKEGLALKIGLQPAYLVSAELSASARGASGSVDIASRYNKFDLSIPVGISYEKNRLVFDARYNWGLTKLLKDVSTSENGRNSVFNIMVGYKF